MTEQWLPVVGYEGLYSVSDQGAVRSEERLIKGRSGGARIWRSRLLKPGRSAGYPCVTLYREGQASKRRVHQLVTEAFLGPRPLGMEVLHRDDIRVNNTLVNLRYGSHAENGADITRNRTKCKYGHRFTDENTYVRPDNGRRQCRRCNRDRQRQVV